MGFICFLFPFVEGKRERNVGRVGSGEIQEELLGGSEHGQNNVIGKAL